MKPLHMFFLVVGLMVLGVVIYTERTKINRRIKNAEYAEGVIVEKGSRAKSDHYAAYTFSVDSVMYKGEVSQRFCKKKKPGCCAIGNKVKVRFEKGNPANNDLVPGCP